ncbi:lactonase family protein [Georgenia subflava]|uniref:Beta-propeller fold lactonase family protein n=1 Tax=Georgenia subflava TaxID=1622177 RepID=A0A6N7EK93_9MICO|nr:beta-propeller fold lactonase family protein [Georgenia subflava]MPV35684.1 beta-propeller fold lactonase family protein [Georgenia subflava]
MSSPTSFDELTLDRRQFGALVAGAALVPGLMGRDEKPEGRRHGHPPGRRRRVAFYASTGPELMRYHVDSRALALTPGGFVTLPAAIQYAWPHPSRRLLYAAYSDRAGTNPGTVHGVATLRIDDRGDLRLVGAPLELPSRPIHITVDAEGRWLLAAYNDPSGVEVYRIDDGMPSELVVQPEPIDAGVYAHQVRVTPSNRTVILPTRGNDATDTTPEDPGALKVFDFVDGRLLDERSIAPDGGVGFGPRHVDFDPRGRWTYVSDERANELSVFRLRAGTLAESPSYSLSTLRSPSSPQLPGQVAGPIHVADDGRHVYLANRADATTEVDGQQVFAGGENSIAVFRIDRESGRPRRIQNADTESFHVRTFALHPDGRMLVTASVAPMLVQRRRRVRTVPARLTVFRIRDDGRLDLVRTYDVDTTAGTQFWCGMVAY